MPTLRELLAGLSNEELEALKQEFIKAQASGGEIVSEQGRGLLKANMPSRIGRAALAGIQAGGQSIVSDVREMAGFKKPEKTTAEELNEFLLKEKLKNAIDPTSILSQMELEEIRKKRLAQGETAITPQGIVTTPESLEVTQPVSPKEETPPMFIEKPKGKNKYGIMEYETIENPEYKQWQKKEDKVMEFDVKKEQLKKDLESFFAVDDLIDRAKGGFLETRGAGLTSQYRAIAQPVTKEGKPDIKGTAARVHDAAVKRLRVQLVRAAGDVGNINIVEQEAAEKLIPSFYDSESAAELKRAYLTEISSAINSDNPNAVKAVLDKAGIGYIEIGGTTIPQSPNQSTNEREQAKQILLKKGYSEQEAEQMLGQ